MYVFYLFIMLAFLIKCLAVHMMPLPSTTTIHAQLCVTLFAFVYACYPAV